MREKIGWLVFLGLVVVAGIGGDKWAGRKQACRVEMVSDSQVLEVKVTDGRKFSEFMQEFVPCENGQFTVGEPVNLSGPYRVSRLAVEFSDRQGKTGSRDAERKSQMTYGYEFYPGQSLARIRLQVEREFAKRENFGVMLPYIIAARADAMYKYTDTSAWMDRTVRLEDFGWSLEKAGLSYRLAGEND